MMTYISPHGRIVARIGAIALCAALPLTVAAQSPSAPVQSIFGKWCSGTSRPTNGGSDFARLVYMFTLNKGQVMVDAYWASNSHESATLPERGMNHGVDPATAIGDEIEFTGRATGTQISVKVTGPASASFGIFGPNGRWHYAGTMHCIAPAR